MFDYVHVVELTEVDIKNHLKRVNYQAQLLIEAPLFYELGNALLKGQMAGKFFEIIVVIPQGFKPLEMGSLMHRLVQSGASIGFLEGGFMIEDMELFALLDNKVLISTKLHDIEKDVMALVFQKHKEFEKVMGISQKVKTSSQNIKIQFKADNYFVSKNQPVQLSWEIENADLVVLNPGAMVLESEGSISLPIEEDTLFTISCKNAKYKRTLSIFIKYLEEDILRLSLLVYNRDLDTFIEIDPVKPDDHRYAVYKGDLIKVEWVCKGEFKLSEEGMGQLENIGFQDIILMHHKVFQFSAQQDSLLIDKRMEVIPISDDEILSDQPIGLDEKKEASSIKNRSIAHEKLNKTWLHKLGLKFKK